MREKSASYVAHTSYYPTNAEPRQGRGDKTLSLAQLMGVTVLLSDIKQRQSPVSTHDLKNTQTTAASNYM